MAAPSEPTIVRTRRDEPCPAGCTGAHSYTADDVRWCLPGADPARTAIDVELSDQAPPAVLVARQHGSEDFWRAWTRLEVVAKLTGIPVLTLVGRGELGRPAPAGIQVRHLARPTAVICIGTVIPTG